MRRLIARHSNRALLETLFAHLIVNQPLLGFAYGRGSMYWRGRICNSADGFDQVCDVIYPPPHKTPVGRLNDPMEPIFYASTRAETVFNEIGAKEDDYVHLIGVRIRPRVAVHLMAIGELFHVYKAGFSRMAGGDGIGREVSRQINFMGLKYGMRVLYVDALLSAILTDVSADAVKYVRSRALATAVFDKISGAEGFFYPSIRDQIGTNLVIKRAAFDAKLHVVSSRVVKILKRRSFGFFESTNIRHAGGTSEVGEFEWLSDCDESSRIVFGMTPSEEQFCRAQGDKITPDTYSEFISLAGMPDC